MPERRAWSSEEDKLLKELREDLQISKWSIIAKKMAEEFNMPDRTGKQCRERYHNHLDSTILRTEWTPDQQDYLYKLHDDIGNKWAIIAQKLPGRTDNCVKNHFYSKMRKAIRKLNKVIYQYFKKEIKQVKMTVLYKIIEATDQRFKVNPNVEQDISQRCCKLKNILLTYSNDNNVLEEDIPKLGQIARSIHEFSSKYRRKPKKTRRPTQGTDLEKLPKFEHKIRPLEDEDEEESEHSMIISHSGEEQEESVVMAEIPVNKTNLEAIKEVVEDLKESTNSKAQIIMVERPQAELPKPRITLMQPPTIVNTLKPPALKNNLVSAPKHVENRQIMEQFLRNKGILENSIELSANLKQSGAFKHVGPRSLSLKADESVELEFGSGSNNNVLGNSIFNLGDSVEKVRLVDINFDNEMDDDSKLFGSN